ncbi:MAG: hypothetical protein KAT71_05650 [Gammaproteobacteria bacterium]|nr:hypothetical protein [Gammaproteobacteria bacterium]
MPKQKRANAHKFCTDALKGTTPVEITDKDFYVCSESVKILIFPNIADPFTKGRIQYLIDYIGRYYSHRLQLPIYPTIHDLALGLIMETRYLAMSFDHDEKQAITLLQLNLVSHLLAIFLINKIHTSNISYNHHQGLEDTIYVVIEHFLSHYIKPPDEETVKKLLINELLIASILKIPDPHKLLRTKLQDYTNLLNGYRKQLSIPEIPQVWKEIEDEVKQCIQAITSRSHPSITRVGIFVGATVVTLLTMPISVTVPIIALACGATLYPFLGYDLNKAFIAHAQNKSLNKLTHNDVDSFIINLIKIHLSNKKYLTLPVKRKKPVAKTPQETITQPQNYESTNQPDTFEHPTVQISPEGYAFYTCVRGFVGQQSRVPADASEASAPVITGQSTSNILQHLNYILPQGIPGALIHGERTHKTAMIHVVDPGAIVPNNIWKKVKVGKYAIVGPEGEYGLKRLNETRFELKLSGGERFLFYLSGKTSVRANSDASKTKMVPSYTTYTQVTK